MRSIPIHHPLLPVPPSATDGFSSSDYRLGPANSFLHVSDFPTPEPNIRSRDAAKKHFITSRIELIPIQDVDNAQFTMDFHSLSLSSPSSSLIVCH